MKDSQYEKILIHPHNGATDEKRQIWSLWQSDPDTYVIRSGDMESLDKTSFLNDERRYPSGSILVVGGQSARACVNRFLKALVQHPRVFTNDLEVMVAKRATEELFAGDLQRVVWEINQKNPHLKLRIK